MYVRFDTTVWQSRWASPSGHRAASLLPPLWSRSSPLFGGHRPPLLWLRFVIVLVQFNPSISLHLPSLGLVLFLVVAFKIVFVPLASTPLTTPLPLAPPPPPVYSYLIGAHLSACIYRIRYVPNHVVPFPVSHIAFSATTTMNFAVVHVVIVQPALGANALSPVNGVPTHLESGYMYLVPALFILPVSSLFAAILALVVPDVANPDASGLLHAGTEHFVPETAAATAAWALFISVFPPGTLPAFAVPSATHDTALERVIVVLTPVPAVRSADAMDLLRGVPGHLLTSTGALMAAWALSLSVFPSPVVRALGGSSTTHDIALELAFVYPTIVVPSMASEHTTGRLHGLPVHVLPATVAATVSWPVFPVLLAPVVGALGLPSATNDIAGDLLFGHSAASVIGVIMTGHIHVANAVSHVYVYHGHPNAINHAMDVDDPDYPMADDTIHYTVDTTEDVMDVDI